MANSRKYYSEYIGHYVRFYLIYPGQVRFKTEADRKMYQCVEQVWAELDVVEQDIIKRLYLSKQMPAEVEAVAKEQGLQPTSLWKTLSRFEAEVATAGGLL